MPHDINNLFSIFFGWLPNVFFTWQKGITMNDRCYFKVRSAEQDEEQMHFGIKPVKVTAVVWCGVKFITYHIKDVKVSFGFKLGATWVDIKKLFSLTIVIAVAIIVV